MRTVGHLWIRALAAGLILAAVQAAALTVVILIWQSGRGSLGTGFYVAYFVGLVLVAPTAGWMLAARLVGGRRAPWLAWPVAMANLVVVLFGHAFEDAGLPVWTPVTTIALLALIVGAEWFLVRGFETSA